VNAALHSDNDPRVVPLAVAADRGKRN